MSARLRARYGASPLHLAGHVAAFALTLWVVSRVFDARAPWNWVAWFVLAALLHDVVFLPLYSGLDRIAQGRRAPGPGVNYVRVPAVLSGVLLLVFFPLILTRADGNYARVTGHHVEGYGRNWLLITAGLFLASALIAAGRAVAGRRRRGPSRTPGPSPGPPPRSPAGAPSAGAEGGAGARGPAAPPRRSGPSA
jgi:hypothetical protein